MVCAQSEDTMATVVLAHVASFQIICSQALIKLLCPLSSVHAIAIPYDQPKTIKAVIT